MKLRQKIRKTLIFLSVILFPVTMFYYSPYVIIMAATESVICGSFILFALMLLFSIFFGRIFCVLTCSVYSIFPATYLWKKGSLSLYMLDGTVYESWNKDSKVVAFARPAYSNRSYKMC